MCTVVTFAISFAVQATRFLFWLDYCHCLILSLLFCFLFSHWPLFFSNFIKIHDHLLSYCSVYSALFFGLWVYAGFSVSWRASTVFVVWQSFHCFCCLTESFRCLCCLTESFHCLCCLPESFHCFDFFCLWLSVVFVCLTESVHFCCCLIWFPLSLLSHSEPLLSLLYMSEFALSLLSEYLLSSFSLSFLSHSECSLSFLSHSVFTVFPVFPVFPCLCCFVIISFIYIVSVSV